MIVALEHKRSIHIAFILNMEPDNKLFSKTHRNTIVTINQQYLIIKIISNISIKEEIFDVIIKFFPDLFLSKLNNIINLFRLYFIVYYKAGRIT